jgi:Mrp family chromosome partitioning ATPase/capsular polysaccharide biosynthesis protein
MRKRVQSMLETQSRNSYRFADVAPDRNAREEWREGVSIPLLLAKIRARRALLWRFVMVAVAVSMALATMVIVLRPAVYRAGSEILIANTTLQLSGQDAVVTQLMVENTLLQSQMLLARSNAVMQRMVEKLGGERIKAMLPQPGLIGKVIGTIDPRAGRQALESGAAAPERVLLIQSLKANILVSRIGASQILGLSARGSTAEAAAELANEATQAYLAELREINAVVTTSGAFRERIRVLGPTARAVSEATPPAGKEGPRALLLLLGLPMIGGLLGLGLSATVAIFSRHIWTGEQLAALTQAEFFGVIRDDAPISVSTDTLHSGACIASVLRRVRAAVMERPGGKPRVIGITSPVTQSGKSSTTKSSTALGLALLFARDGGRVLLVDASPAEQALSKCLGLEDRPGLRQVLAAPPTFRDSIQAELRKGLDVLGAGQSMGDADILWPNLLKSFGSGQGPLYDWVILDLPALDEVTGVRTACAIVDDLVIAVDRGRASETVLSEQLGMLGPARDKIIGTILHVGKVIQKTPALPNPLTTRPRWSRSEAKASAPPKETVHAKPSMPIRPSHQPAAAGRGLS